MLPSWDNEPSSLYQTADNFPNCVCFSFLLTFLRNRQIQRKHSLLRCRKAIGATGSVGTSSSFLLPDFIEASPRPCCVALLWSRWRAEVTSPNPDPCVCKPGVLRHHLASDSLTFCFPFPDSAPPPSPFHNLNPQTCRRARVLFF